MFLGEFHIEDNSKKKKEREFHIEDIKKKWCKLKDL